MTLELEDRFYSMLTKCRQRSGTSVTRFSYLNKNNPDFAANFDSVMAAPFFQKLKSKLDLQAEKVLFDYFVYTLNELPDVSKSVLRIVLNVNDSGEKITNTELEEHRADAVELYRSQKDEDIAIPNTLTTNSRYRKPCFS